MSYKLIKTDVEIGEEVGKSRIDGTSMRKVSERELELLFPSEYEIIQPLENYIEDFVEDLIDIHYTKLNFIKPKVKRYNIDWDKVTKIEDIKKILMVANISFNINFNIDNDVKIYNIVKDFLKEKE